jgi:hypothetical protein
VDKQGRTQLQLRYSYAIKGRHTNLKQKLQFKKEKSMHRHLFERVRKSTRKSALLVQAAVLATAGVVPLVIMGSASATPTLTSRQLTSTSARPSQVTQLAWIFNTTSDTANIKQIEIEFCNQPLGACTTTNAPSITASPAATLSNFTTNTVTSTTRTSGDNGGTNNQIDVVKTNADAGASISAAQVQLAASDITNNAAANTTYYTRMRIYSDTGTTLVWEGVFAQSTSQTLTVNARVQERLDFCVGADNVDDATSTTDADTAANNNCADITGTNVDLGSVESGFTNVSPVAVGNGGDGENGVAMVRTNAQSGVSVAYKALQNSSSGRLKVAGASCSGSGAVDAGSGNVDQCFNSNATQSTSTAGTERFGMTIAGINCGSVVAYTCNFGGGTYNITRNANYDGDGSNTYVAESDQVSGTTTNGYAWQSDGTAATIASSSTVVDDELMVLKFGATAAATTPTGSYTVQADFIATATF